MSTNYLEDPGHQVLREDLEVLVGQVVQQLRKVLLEIKKDRQFNY